MRVVSLAVAASTALLATPLFAAVTVENLSKAKLSGGGSVVNIFAGKAAKEGIIVKTSIDGDWRAMRTDRDVEVIDLGSERIWTYKLSRKGKPGKCKMTNISERREAMAALNDLDFSAGQQPPEDMEASGTPEYEVTINATETGEEETHAGLTGKVVNVEVIVHQAGMTLEEGGGSKIDTRLVIGPKPAGWEETVDWNQRYMQALNIDIEGAEGLGKLMTSFPAMKKAMASLQDKEATFDGAVLSSDMTVYTMPDPRAMQQADSDSGGVPTSVGDLGAKIGGSLLRKRKEKKAAAGPQETFKSTTVLTSYAAVGDDLLTLPERCEQ